MRVYNVPLIDASLPTSGAPIDLIGLYCGADMAIKLHALYAGQVTTTNIEFLKFSINLLTATVTAGSGGSAITPTHDTNDPAATFTARGLDTTPATGGAGSPFVRHADDWNLINGLFYMPAPEQRIIAKPGEALIISLDSLPSAARVVRATAVVEELF